MTLSFAHEFSVVLVLCAAQIGTILAITKLCMDYGWVTVLASVVYLAITWTVSIAALRHEAKEKAAAKAEGRHT